MDHKVEILGSSKFNWSLKSKLGEILLAERLHHQGHYIMSTLSEIFKILQDFLIEKLDFLSKIAILKLFAILLDSFDRSKFILKPFHHLL